MKKKTSESTSNTLFRLDNIYHWLSESLTTTRAHKKNAELIGWEWVINVVACDQRRSSRSQWTSPRPGKPTEKKIVCAFGVVPGTCDAGQERSIPQTE